MFLRIKCFGKNNTIYCNIYLSLSTILSDDWIIKPFFCKKCQMFNIQNVLLPNCRPRLKTRPNVQHGFCSVNFRMSYMRCRHELIPILSGALNITSHPLGTYFCTCSNRRCAADCRPLGTGHRRHRPPSACKTEHTRRARPRSGCGRRPRSCSGRTDRRIWAARCGTHTGAGWRRHDSDASNGNGSPESGRVGFCTGREFPDSRSSRYR